MAWRRWMIPGGIAAAAVIAATSTIFAAGQRTSSAAAVHRASRTTTASVTAVRAAADTTNPAPPTATPMGHDTVYIASSPSELAAAQLWLDSLRTAYPMDMELALLQSDAEARRLARAAGSVRATTGRDSSARPARDTGGRGGSGEANVAPDTVRRDSAVAPEPAP
jgi:folate-dependent tRNA-U54 methylase TrmFO/GidA